MAWRVCVLAVLLLVCRLGQVRQGPDVRPSAEHQRQRLRWQQRRRRWCCCLRSLVMALRWFQPGHHALAPHHQADEQQQFSSCSGCCLPAAARWALWVQALWWHVSLLGREGGRAKSLLL